MTALLLMALALAQDAPADPPAAAPELPAAPETAVTPAEAPPDLPAPTLEEVWSQQDPDDLFTQAVAFQEVGNREAALKRLLFLAERHPDPLVTFQIGKTLELMEDYGGALARYDEVLSSGPAPELSKEAAFRRALVLEDLGRHAESAAQVRELQGADGWSAEDEQALALARGIAELNQGKERRGIKRISAALEALEGTPAHPWMRARARAALAAHLLREAAATELTAERKAAKRLSQRTDLIVAAEQQVLGIVQLGDPEYSLEGLLLLGDAYIALYDDFRSTPPPRSLSPEQVAIYQEQIGAKARILRQKAKNYYGEGVKLAERVEWEGSLAQALQARHQAL